MNSASVPLPADAPVHARAPAGPTPAPAPIPASAWPVSILGVPFDSVTINGALERIEQMIASRQPHYVVTANVDFLVQAHRDVELRRILLESDLVLCDGTPLVWASRWLGNALPERVAGADLAPSLIAKAARQGHRLFFLGAAPGVAAAAARQLQTAYPTLNIVGHYAPPFAALLEMDHAEIVRRIREAKPDILLVSFGCPKQEKWISMHYRSLGVPVSIGVGATIDFLAGRVRRAPDWMRRSGTEWIFRLLLEPRRLYRRYAKDLTCFLPTLATQWCRLSVASAPAGRMRAAPTVGPDWVRIDAGEQLTLGALQAEAEFWREVPTRGVHCLVDVSAVRRIDGTGIAFLLRWRKQLQARGRQLVLLAPSARLERVLATLRLSDYFSTASDPAEAVRLLEASTAQTPVLRDSATRSLAWCGEIIAANVEDVWQMTTDHMQAFVASGANLIIIDLERLRFIDSAGAGLMLRLKKWAQQFPAEILFTHAQGNVRNVLRLARLDQLLLEGAQ